MTNNNTTTKNINAARMCFERLIKDVTDKQLAVSLREKFKVASKEYDSMFALLQETVRASVQSNTERMCFEFLKNKQLVVSLREKFASKEYDSDSMAVLLKDTLRVSAHSLFLSRIKDPFVRLQMEKMLSYNPQILEIMNSRFGGGGGGRAGGGRGGGGRGGGRVSAKGVLALDKRYFLVYGKCQSGKTRFMQDVVFSHVLFNKCAAIVILRNCVGDSRQLQKRCDEYRLIYEKWTKMNDPDLKGEGLNFVYANTESKAKELQKALSGKKPSLIIVIANSTQMTRVKKAITDTKNPRYVVAIDEADQVAYGEQATSFRSILQEDILPHAGRVYGVTATSFDMVFTEEKIDTASIILLERSEMYKGLRQIELRGLREIAVPANNTHDWFDNDGNVIPVLSHLGELDCWKNPRDNICDPSYNPEHPTITIIKNTHLNASQDKLLRHITSNTKLTMWAGLIYNGQGITVYHPQSSLLQKMGGKSPCSRKWPDNKKVKNTLFFRGVGISDGLEYLRQLDIILLGRGMSRVTHIAVIAGDLADRGISFVSSGYHWHPTSMYYVPSAGATVSHIIQAAGRLCGNFNDNIPLQLFAPSETLEDLNRGINLQEDILERVKRKVTGSVVNIIKDMEISEAKIPYRDMGHQVDNEESAVKMNLIEGQDDGVQLSTFKENKINKMLPTDKTKEDTEEDTEEDIKVDSDNVVVIQKKVLAPFPEHIEFYDHIIAELQNSNRTWVYASVLYRPGSRDGQMTARWFKSSGINKRGDYLLLGKDNEKNRFVFRRP